MPLPTAPVTNTADTMRPDLIRAVIYGKPGAGKTTFASGWFPQTNLLLEVDADASRFIPGSHFVQPIKSYADFSRTVDELCAGGHNFQTVTIDTGDRLFRMADNEAGQRYGQAAAQLAEYGKGGELRDATFLRDIDRLFSAGLGCLLLAHPDTTTTLVGKTEVVSVEPRIVRRKRDDIRQEVIGLFDYELFIRKEDHKLVTGGDPLVSTKRRVPLPDVMDSDPGQFYLALKAGIEQAAAGTNNTPTPKEKQTA